MYHINVNMNLTNMAHIFLPFRSHFDFPQLTRSNTKGESPVSKTAFSFRRTNSRCTVLVVYSKPFLSLFNQPRWNLAIVSFSQPRSQRELA